MFDCLALAGEDLREEPLSERRRAAAQVVAELGAPFHLVDQVPAAEAPALWRQVVAGDLEGVVLKDSTAP